MRALMWFGLIAGLTISVLIACVPGPAPASAGALIHSPFGDAAILHVCDKQGVCCYWARSSSVISCVATRTIVIVSPGELKDERKDESSSEAEGETGSSSLENRFLRNYQL